MFDPARGSVLDGVGPGGPGTAAVSKHETKSVTQHEGGVRGGGFPPGTATVSKHETGTVTKQTTGARGGGPGGVRGGFPPRYGCCVQARDRYCD